MNVEENSAVRPRGTDSAKLMVVIVTESLKGCGTEDDPGVSTENYLQPEKGGEKMRKAGMYVLGASLGVILAKIVSALIRALLA